METYDFEFINTYNGTRSPTGRVQNDYTTAYFTRCLYQRAISTLTWTLPDGWNKQYFLNVLYRNGFIAIVKTAEYGIIPQVCTLSGYGLYMQPTKVLVSQPLVRFEGDIGTDCELIKLTPDYRGIWDVIEHYAVQLSTCYTSLKMSLENSRLSFLLAAKNKAAAETLKDVAERISSGEAVIIVDKLLKDTDDGEPSIWTESFNPADSYITDKLLTNITDIINAFDREVGIKTVSAKKERMIVGEVEQLTSDAGSRLSTWEECLDESIANVKKLFPELTLSYKERSESYEPSAKIDADRDV